MSACQEATCGSTADVRIEQVTRPSTCVCWKHLMRMLLTDHSDIRGFRRLDWSRRASGPAATQRPLPWRGMPTTFRGLRAGNTSMISAGSSYHRDR
jgi:hypothetical protein